MPSDDRRAFRSAFRAARRAIAPRGRRSWTYAAPGFADALAYLRTDPAALAGAERIWFTEHHDVWKLTLPAALGGETVVYKHNHAVQPRRRWKDALIPGHLTAAGGEAVNLGMFGRLGMAAAVPLAAGDVRTFWRVESTFLVTRYVAGFEDGRVFLPGGARAHDAARRDAFIRAVLACLARMHGACFYHQGARPYNFLWRSDDALGKPGPMELCLIDLATGRFHPAALFASCVERDLARFFEYFEPGADALVPYLDFYRERNPRCRRPSAELAARLVARFTPNRHPQLRPATVPATPPSLSGEVRRGGMDSHGAS